MSIFLLTGLSKALPNLDMRSSWFNKHPVNFGPRPPWNWLFLCLICVFVLVALLGSSSSSTFDSATTFPRPDIYMNYRRLKQQAASDYLELKSFSLGSYSQEFSVCGKERENYVPCYNVTGNLLAGFKDGEEFDRHCEVSDNWDHCLLSSSKDYKLPLSWPSSRDVIWSGNVKLTKDQFLSSGSMTKRLMLLEENQIAFHSDDGLIVDGVKDYSRQIAEMLGLGSDIEFSQNGVHTVLDVGCGFGSFGAHLHSLNLMAVCVAAYELTGSQVQIALERGLPAVIGNFISRQLPFPSLSFDMVHCAQCGIVWNNKDGIFLIEVDRLLRPGGYFVLTSSANRQQGGSLRKNRGRVSTPVEDFSKRLCWNLLAQQEDTFIWQKSMDAQCYASSNQNAIPQCYEEQDSQSYYQPLAPCVSGINSKRWISIQNRSLGSQLSVSELQLHGVYHEDYAEDLQYWKSALRNYWSLLTPLIFSDHPKRPGDEDPLPPYNMLRNVMDMNAHYGGFNAAFLEAGNSVWVMNVVPVGKRNTLPLILDRGFLGVLHDWCEPFPTYPRTYDMLNANGLLTHLTSKGCSMMGLLLEMDRILRPEGWVVLSDRLEPIEKARMLATLIRWEARVIDLQKGSDHRLLVCQKPSVRK